MKTELQEHPDEVDTPTPHFDRVVYGWAIAVGFIAACLIVSLIFGGVGKP